MQSLNCFMAGRLCVQKNYLRVMTHQECSTWNPDLFVRLYWTPSAVAQTNHLRGLKTSHAGFPLAAHDHEWNNLILQGMATCWYLHCIYRIHLTISCIFLKYGNHPWKQGVTSYQHATDLLSRYFYTSTRTECHGYNRMRIVPVKDPFKGIFFLKHFDGGWNWGEGGWLTIMKTC